MSLRTRLFATYALVITVCLMLVGLSFTLILRGYRERLTTEHLRIIAGPVSWQLRLSSLRQSDAEEIWQLLEEQAVRNKVYILLGDDDGNILRQAAPVETDDVPLLRLAPGVLPIDIADTENGNFRTASGQVLYYVAYSLDSNQQFQFVGDVNSLVLATPRTGVMVVAQQIFRWLVIAGIITMGVSLLVAVLIARSIYRPIAVIGEAARQIAQGKYDQQVPVNGPAELKKLAQSFNRMTAQVKSSQEQLRHFVADVSHQLRTPLTSIQGFAQAIIDGTAASDEDRLKAVTIIDGEAKRMRHQVDEVLELARMQAGQVKMITERIDIQEILSQCKEIFDVQAAEKDINIKLAAVTRLTTMGDSDRLEQVFNNLIDNAIKNSPAGTVVSISATKAEADGNIEIKISNEGPGIPPEQIPHIFERYYRTSGLRGGSGLGLAIAREIVDAHHGTIRARSEPGEGAEFIVSLPSTPEN